jgi:hypothetical protein
MSRHDTPTHDPARLHAAVYKTLIGLVVWMVLSIWLFFDNGAYSPLLLAVVTGFFAILTAIPLLIWRTRQHAVAKIPTPGSGETFRKWLSGAFETSTGPLRSSEAVAQILLPIAAVCIGMTLFGIVLWLTLPTISSA